jgi:Leucine-rich repeat (LRR) protein
MKTVKLLCLCALAGAAIFLSFCGKDKGTNPTTGPQANTYEADTLAAKAILDANSITTIAPTDDICFRKDQRPQGTGPYRIVEIRLIKKSISVIPADIGKLTALEKIWLDSNNIASLPSQIGTCKAVTFLDLSCNHLTTLPQEIGSLTNLVYCKLSYNSLATLPSGFWSMTAMTTVLLDNNALTGIDAGVSSLTNATRFDISHNQVASLPESITLLANMVIVVDYNKLCPVSQTVADFITHSYGDTTWKATQCL